LFWETAKVKVRARVNVKVKNFEIIMYRLFEELLRRNKNSFSNEG